MEVVRIRSSSSRFTPVPAKGSSRVSMLVVLCVGIGGGPIRPGAGGRACIIDMNEDVDSSLKIEC